MRLLIIITVVFAVAAALMIFAWHLFTRYAAHPGEASRRVPCGFRAGHRNWSRGTLSYEADCLVYRSSQMPLGHKEERWLRSGLGVGVGRPLDGAEVGAAWRGSVVVSVPCTYAGEPFELAISKGRYTALRSWVEAVPPGWNVNVA
ncbi:hypothetical protein BH23ACT6_BH23ACT6_07360 [soil metagenome]